MYKYNKTNSYSSHILDPDYSYHTSIQEEELYSFHKNLNIPQNVHNITGVYIQYNIIPFRYEQYPIAYIKSNQAIEKLIEQYLDFGHANLFSNQTNTFYLIMFDVNPNQLNQALLAMKLLITSKSIVYKNKECQFDIQYGIYNSHIFIHPYKLFYACKEQFENTLKHKTIISTK